jgi:hypothetical protein
LNFTIFKEPISIDKKKGKLKNDNKDNNDGNEGSTNQDSIETIMEEILELLNIDSSYSERLTKINNIMQIDANYPVLNITLISPSLNYNKHNFEITPYGLKNSKRGAKDGIVLFGCERKNKNNNSNANFDNLNSEINNNSGNTEENDSFILNDFVFPVEMKEDNYGLYEFPNFAIYFNVKDKSYYIKDFNTGVGALMKIKKVKMEKNTLINIGSNYIVVNIEKNKIIIKLFNHTILENKKSEDNKGQNCIIKEFTINNNKNSFITIGRSNKCDIIIDDVMLSKIHTCIEYNAAKKIFNLYDGDSQKESTNGTWIFILNPVKITDNFMFKAEHTLFIASLTNNK